MSDFDYNRHYKKYVSLIGSTSEIDRLYVELFGQYRRLLIGSCLTSVMLIVLSSVVGWVIGKWLVA